MGLLEDSETSLQVLRGFETDITDELDEIKVSESFLCICSQENISCTFFHSLCFVQRCVASSTLRTAIRFAELKRRRYWYPLMVLWFIFNIFLSLEKFQICVSVADQSSGCPIGGNWTSCTPATKWY